MALSCVIVQHADMNMLARSRYVDILNQAWSEHLASREDNAPTVISAFAGCGGSSIGYSMAGFRELLAVEWDKNAVEVFKLNFPEVPVYHGDITRLSVDECMQLSCITKPGQLDVLDGSPPCQGFSIVGSRQFTDDRNQLFHQYVRLLEGLQPKVFVMENVSGMIKGKMKLIFADILHELKQSGYQVIASLMNAMYFHVPQSRQRLIFLGVRDDLGITPSLPMAESRPITIKQAWDGLVVDTKGLELTPKFLGYWQAARIGDAVGTFNAGRRKLSINKPSSTICADGDSYHPLEPRVLATSETKRLHSYPDQFTFAGSRINAKHRIGNSVPPLLMRAIAQHIRQVILP